MSEEKKGKFSKCEEGKKCLSVEFRVFEKKMEEKFGEQDFLVEIFAKFVFTGWASC